MNFKFALSLFILMGLAQATTVIINFNYSIFENPTFKDMGKNWSYTDNLTTPDYVVEGFKLRADDFMVANKEFFRTYNTSTGGNVTVFEMKQFIKSMVESESKNDKKLIGELQKSVETERERANSAEAVSCPAMMELNVALMIGFLVVAIMVALFYIAKQYGDRKPTPQQRIKPTMMEEIYARKPRSELDELIEEFGDDRRYLDDDRREIIC